MADERPAIMIFAAGLGTRMGDLTKDRPKPLIPVAGKPLFDHAIDQANTLPTAKLVANIHAFADLMASACRDRGVEISHEPALLDTGGGLRQALPLLNAETVYTLNSDAVWIGPPVLQLIRRHWDPDRMDALLAVLPHDRAVGRTTPGDFTRAKAGRLSRRGDSVYTGAQIIKTAMLSEIEPAAFSLNVLWDKMLKNGTLFGVEYPGHWCDVGHPGGIHMAEDALENFGHG